jgi:small-conductance mechanosensitive channel
MTLRSVIAVALLALAVPTSPQDLGTKAPPKAQGASADLSVFNRHIATFRAPVLGVTAEDRVQRAVARIHDLLERSGKHAVTEKATPMGRVVSIDGAFAFVLVPEDVDPLKEEDFDTAVGKAVQALQVVVEETRESRDLRALSRGGLISLAATGILILLIWGLRRLRLALTRRLTALAETHARKLRLGGSELVNRERLLFLVQWLVNLLFWVVTLLLVYEWLGFILARFPYTRPWGEGLIRFLSGMVVKVLSAIVNAIPGLVLAAVVFIGARFVIQMLRTFFDRVERGDFVVRWLDPETVLPTRRIASVVVWLFALAMAYPYLPGAGTDAFKGLSVLIGLMISLGASSVIGQGASGLILMYSRTLRVGDYVRINDHEGTVVEAGLFVTRIRTGMGEELTLSNALVVGAVTRNYSRVVKGPGFIVDTVVTIGYDAPWRQVEAMLLEAARRTKGVVQEPPSRVHQTALSDFYVEYRLVTYAVPEKPVPRALVLTALHANIQDVFNEHGVQIMSPHYLGDPAQAKVVAKADWYPAPAIPPGVKSGGGGAGEA